MKITLLSRRAHSSNGARKRFQVPHRVAIIGGGLTGISILTGLVRAAIDGGCAHLHVTLFERAEKISPGLAYGTGLPLAFTLNHEQNDMGSVNVHLPHADKLDFHYWVQGSLPVLAPLYPDHDLRDKRGFVPRSLYGRYLDARYEETLEQARRHGISITTRHAEVTAVRPLGRELVVECDAFSESFDELILATGNWSDEPGRHFDATGRSFRGYEWEKYLRNDAIADRSTMHVSGTGLSAYDAAIAALDSGKYAKVVMSSRRGTLRRVRGRVCSYQRKVLTIDNLARMAGPGQPFRLAHVIDALRKELELAYGYPVEWQERRSAREAIAQLRAEAALVERGEELKWRSVYASVSDPERHEIYTRMAEQDLEEFHTRLGQLFLSHHAPMPLSKARTLLKYIDAGMLEIVDGARETMLGMETGKFVLWYAPDDETSAGTAETLRKHPLQADVYVSARGPGRDIGKVLLYRQLAESGMVELHPGGGIRVDLKSHRVMAKGKLHDNFYALGHMRCGETILTHNALTVARLGVELGAQIVSQVRRTVRA